MLHFARSIQDGCRDDESVLATRPRAELQCLPSFNLCVISQHAQVDRLDSRAGRVLLHPQWHKVRVPVDMQEDGEREQAVQMHAWPRSGESGLLSLSSRVKACTACTGRVELSGPQHCMAAMWCVSSVVCEPIGCFSRASTGCR